MGDCLLWVGMLAFAMAFCPKGDADTARHGTLSFGVIADVQYADKEDLGSRRYRHSLGLLETAVANLNGQHPSFVVQLGDLVDSGEDSLDPALSVFNQLKTTKHHVLGNHDFPISREAVLRKLGLMSAYYSFAQDGWRFVVLDTQDVSVDGGWPAESDHYEQAEAWLEQLGKEGKPNAEPWNGGIGKAQKEWLSGQLAEASAKGEKVIVMGHIPILAAASGDWCLLYNHDEILQTLEHYQCVVAYLSGHDHGGGYAERNGIHHVTMQGMVEAGPESAYAIVTLFPDRIEIKGTGAVPSRTLKVVGRVR